VDTMKVDYVCLGYRKSVHSESARKSRREETYLPTARGRNRQSSSNNNRFLFLSLAASGKSATQTSGGCDPAVKLTPLDLTGTVAPWKEPPSFG
jgi:hypothetical protein